MYDKYLRVYYSNLEKKNTIKNYYHLRPKMKMSCIIFATRIYFF